MSWTAEDLDALDAAIKGGVKRVEYHDKVVEYRSLAEMLQIRKLILGQMAPTAGAGRSYRRYACVTKGVRP